MTRERIRDLSTMDLYDAVASRELTAEQAVDEMERREVVLRGRARAWVPALTSAATGASGAALLSLGYVLAGALILVSASIYGAEAFRAWRAWRKATAPEVTK